METIVTDLQWREYYLKEARRAIKDGLPRTAKQCLANARLFENLGKTPQSPTTKEVR